MTTAAPRQRRHEKSQQAILDIAAKLIGEHGHEKLSLREVARQADYSPAGLYEYFKSKAEILDAISVQIGQQLVLMLNTVPENLPPKDRLVQLALIYIQFAISNKEQFQLMNSLPARRRSLNEPASQGSPYNIFLQTVQTAIDSGVIKPQRGYKSEEITYSLWALIHGMAMLQLTHLQDFQVNFTKVDRQAINVFLDGMQS